MLLSAERSVLMIVDVQERLSAAVPGVEGVVSALGLLVDAARRLGVPTVATEQHPQALGPTLAALTARFGEGVDVVAKIAFNAVEEPVLVRRIAEWRLQGRSQIVVGGLEAHICVLQTAIGLVAEGFDVAVVADGVGSRRAHSREVALPRLTRHGVDVVTAEMVVYEWLGRAGTDVFRDILPLVRGR